MDDLVVYSENLDEHIKHPKEVFRCLENAGFTLNHNKVHLAQIEIKFLGHYLFAQGEKVVPEIVEVIQVSHTKKGNMLFSWHGQILCTLCAGLLMVSRTSS
jgi:hypothetical protein